MRLELQVDGKRFHLDVGLPKTTDAGRKAKRPLSSIQSVPLQSVSSDGDQRVCRSPVNGIVVNVPVQVGDVLHADDLMLVLEAMKMRTSLVAPLSGRLKCVHIQAGQAVRINQVLLEFE
ncbi:MAG TPA: acetyl-CoA carboxylase biotin carboxyl carrier protein subunit [Terriglobales bacterium]|nr:acetyl-CoA carboxylase biotin carboxyl carrier protein subunit [Nitrospira sp.]